MAPRTLSGGTDCHWGFPGGAGGKEPTCQCRRSKRHGFDLLVGKMPRRGEWHPLQYSCLENRMDRGAWWAIAHRVTQSRTWLRWLSMQKLWHSASCSLFLFLFVLFHLSVFSLSSSFLPLPSPPFSSLFLPFLNNSIQNLLFGAEQNMGPY